MCIIVVNINLTHSTRKRIDAFYRLIQSNTRKKSPKPFTLNGRQMRPDSYDDQNDQTNSTGKHQRYKSRPGYKAEQRRVTSGGGRHAAGMWQKIKCLRRGRVEMEIAAHEWSGLAFRGSVVGAATVLGRPISAASWWACSRTEPSSRPSAPASPSAGGRRTRATRAELRKDRNYDLFLTRSRWWKLSRLYSPLSTLKQWFTIRFLKEIHYYNDEWGATLHAETSCMHVMLM